MTEVNTLKNNDWKAIEIRPSEDHVTLLPARIISRDDVAVLERNGFSCGDDNFKHVWLFCNAKTVKEQQSTYEITFYRYETRSASSSYFGGRCQKASPRTNPIQD
ncbi:elongation factor EF1A [Acrasis kona]|uniref:Elongation factor EF1A n=1 Tax=Acrasis kona TaxID=1008807 RepID=A0AAW2YZP0_9EUKA